MDAQYNAEHGVDLACPICRREKGKAVPIRVTKMTTEPKGSERKVKAKYPNAVLTAEAFEGWCIYEGEPRPNNRLSDFHDHFEEAWDDVAQRINAEPER